MIIFQSQLNHILQEHERHTKNLEDQIAFLKGELDREKRRADLAVDTLLNQKQVPSVTPLEKDPAIEEHRKKMSNFMDELTEGLRGVGDPSVLIDDTNEVKA